MPKVIEKSPSQRDNDGFMGLREIKTPRKNKLRGVEKATSEAGHSLLKNPENKCCFRDVNPLRDLMGPVVITFLYPDYTVGSGISPDHARLCGTHFPKGKLLLPKEARGLYHRSGITPCPEGFYSIMFEL